jgi:hypothetical protein
MRVVLKGTAQRLRRVTLGDLPADRDAKFSYFYRCDFGRLDLRGFDFSMCDFIECVGAPNLTGVVDYQLISRRCNWSGAVFGDINPLIHDWVEEILRQYPTRASNPRYGEIMVAAADIIHWTYTNSFQNTPARLVERGYAWDEIRAAARECFAFFPRLSRRFEEEAQLPQPRDIPIIPRAPVVKGRTADGSEVEEQSTSWPATVTRVLSSADRYAIARALETYLAQRYPLSAPFQVVVLQLDPIPDIRAVPQSWLDRRREDIKTFAWWEWL